MSVHFILDGYNVIKKTPALSGGTLKDGRDALVRLLEVKRPQGSLKNKITIVFDGQGASDEVFSLLPPPEGTVHVKVVFSSGESADDRIKRIVEDAGNKKSLKVVTDDRGIRFYVRALGAGVLGVGEFLGRQSAAAHAAGKAGGRDAGKNIPLSLEDKINREFKDIWLDGQQDRC